MSGNLLYLLVYVVILIYLLLVYETLPEHPEHFSKSGHDIKPPFRHKGTINIYTLQTKYAKFWLLLP